MTEAEQGFPAAAGQRLEWQQLPPDVRRRLEARLGSAVVEARTQAGGFSPGVASRLLLADGRRLFVKAVGPAPNPHTAGMHRREGEVAARLPRATPAPRLHWIDDEDGWVALCFDDVDGRQPALPWRDGELRRVLDMVVSLSDVLTPSPISATPFAHELESSFDCFRGLAAGNADVSPEALHQVEPWVLRNLDRLALLEGSWQEAAAGASLLHSDLRADNLLLTEDRVVVVDWPHVSVGAPWIDLLGMLPSIAMQGGPEPADVFDAHPVARGAEPDAVDAVLCALAGYFAVNALRAAPPGLPTLRPFQQAQGEQAVRWLRHRTGWR